METNEYWVFPGFHDLLARFREALEQFLDDLLASAAERISFYADSQPAADTSRRRVVLFLVAGEVEMQPEVPSDSSPALAWGGGSAFVPEHLLSSCASPPVGVRWALESRAARRSHPATGIGIGALSQTGDTTALLPAVSRPQNAFNLVLARRDPCAHADISYRGVVSAN